MFAYFLVKDSMRLSFFVLIISVLWVSCGGSSDGRSSIADLPFEQAKTAKEYADLVLKSIKTNRDKPLAMEFTNPDEINHYQLKRTVGMYSTAMGGRDDWQYYDLYEQSNKKDQSKGFDYAWLEPKGRLGLQIYILPTQDESGRFSIEKLEFRSRIDVMESKGFPHGEIDDYKKLDFKW